MGTLHNLNQALSKAYQPENIIAYKQQLGYAPTIDNVLIGRRLDNFWVGVAKDMVIKHSSHHEPYLISFEDDGILLMQIALLGGFKNNNRFIPVEDFKDLRFKKGLKFTDTVILKSTQGNYRLQINKLAKQPNFQHTNAQKLETFVNQYLD